MKENPDYEKDLATIRSMMERSSKFLSLSGLSGILAGIYALIGAGIAYRIGYPVSSYLSGSADALEADTMARLIAVALVVLTASLLTALWLSARKARKQEQQLWNGTSRRILVNFAVPLIVGGLFILVILYTGHAGLAAPASLIFYGLALFSVSANTYEEVRYLGLCQTVLGLLAAALPGLALVFWALGFGALHIVYGLVMYNKYDK